MGLHNIFLKLGLSAFAGSLPIHHHHKIHRNPSFSPSIQIYMCQVMADKAITTIPPINLPRVARGKVRDLFRIDDRTLLFVASDRISAYDVVMDNVCLTLNL